MSKIGWRWVYMLALKLLVVTVLPIMLGIVLDQRFRTSPIITLSMMLLGLNIGIFTIARSVAAIYARVEENSQRVGGEQ